MKVEQPPEAPPTTLVRELCKTYKLIRPDLSRLTGYSLRAVDKWAAGDLPGTAARKELTVLQRLCQALEGVMEQDYVGEWLKTPNPTFEGSTPLQVIERGEADRIWRMIFQLETGAPR